MLKRVFFHNIHDRASSECLAELMADQVPIDEVVDAYGLQPTKYGVSLRAYPCYAVLQQVPEGWQVLQLSEQENIVVAALLGLEVAEVPVDKPEPTIADQVAVLEQRIADLEEASAMLHLEVSKVAAPSGT